ncbi:BAIP2 protein, partial [Passerina amoena]|nr:BAIP2 protein [Passerina amoena]
MTYAAKGYFDALVKMGELASESQGSKELGDVLFQMAEVHRQIQNQLEEMLKSFHNELLTQLEQKVELDSRYLSAALKKYQTEQRSKGDSLDKCQAELKKLRKKSQGSKNPQKYSDKELQVGLGTLGTPLGWWGCAKAPGKALLGAVGGSQPWHRLFPWAQGRVGLELPAPAAATCATAVTSAMAPRSMNSCSARSMVPRRGFLVFFGRMSAQEAMPVMNGVSGSDSDGYNHWSEMKPAQPKSLSPPQPQKQLSDSYSNTLPVRKNVAPKNSYASAENKTLPRSSSMAAGLERNGRTRVQAIFSHAAGDNSTLLSFKEGDLITLLVPEARDGWHYGESEKTKMRGWFPFSYTRVLDNDGSERVHTSLQQGKSSSTGNLLDKDDISIPPPDYGMASQAFPAQGGNTFKQRPYSVAVPAFSQ